MSSKSGLDIDTSLDVSDNILDKYSGNMKLNFQGTIIELSIMTAIQASKRVKMIVDTCLENKEPLIVPFFDYPLSKFNRLLSKILPPIEDGIEFPLKMTWTEFEKGGLKMDWSRLTWKLKKTECVPMLIKSITNSNSYSNLADQIFENLLLTILEYTLNYNSTDVTAIFSYECKSKMLMLISLSSSNRFANLSKEIDRENKTVDLDFWKVVLGVNNRVKYFFD